jgi:D-3-phosphoglycerate dehydrogenase / 2-oxoglutarate reductase
MIKLLCPSENLFSKEIKKKFQQKFCCTFVNISQRKFQKICHKYEIILMRFSHFLPFKKETKIKFILSPTTGENHIDEKYFKCNNIKIFNLKNNKTFLRNVSASTEFTILLLLNIIRRLNKRKLSPNRSEYIGTEIYKKKIGIIGLGRIGFKLAKILKGFDASVYFFDKIKKKTPLYLKKKSLKFILKNCDILSINIPLNKNNVNFLNKDKIKLIKKNTVIINSSRGEVLDENFLLSFVKKKYLFYSTDVLSDESRNSFARLQKLNKLDTFFGTNHLAGLTQESILKTDLKIYKKFIQYYEKKMF